MNQPLEVNDFSAGMYDEYVNGPINGGKLFNNLVINNNKKPRTRFGSILRDSTYSQIPGGVQRIGHMWDHRDQILEISADNIYFFLSTYQTLLGPSSNVALPASTVSNYSSVAQWNNHSYIVNDSFCSPMKVYKNASSTFTIRNAGLPTITAPTVTKGSSGANSYIYGFHYQYTYSVEGVSFTDLGPTVEVTITSATAPDSSAVAITSIPVIANSTTDNYDTTVITVEIYRTQANGTVLTRIGSVTNGTTTYNDSASDASIVDNASIYTTGDILDYNQPPASKVIHINNDIALFGYVKESGVEIPNRIRQSVKGDPDSCPASFYVDLQDAVTGISSFRETHIAFTKSATYRIEGFFDEQGRGGMTANKISDTIGCVSNDSIVQTDQGLFFASLNGFYFCNGYQFVKISQHIDETYSNLVSTTTKQRRIYGSYDKINNRIWWAVHNSASAIDNDSCIILDLNWGTKPESCFTTSTNGKHFAPTALLFIENNLYRADRRGYVFKHHDDHKTDPRVEITVTPSSWAKAPIISDYISCAIPFGTTYVRKFVPKVLLTLSNKSNIAVKIVSNNDDGRVVDELSEIRYTSNIVWGDPNIVWGDDSIIWNEKRMIDEKRHFPANSLRCNYKQIQITNKLSAILNSDTIGLAAVDNTALTLTLASATYTWPDDVVGYFLSFEADSYTQTFEITERTSDTVVTVLDPLGLFPATASGYKWLLTGYRKNEVLEILSYVLHYKLLSDSQKGYRSSETGENA